MLEHAEHPATVGEARKERLSPVFQAVVTTAVYLLAHASGTPEGGPVTQTATG